MPLGPKLPGWKRARIVRAATPSDTPAAPRRRWVLITHTRRTDGTRARRVVWGQWQAIARAMRGEVAR